MVQIQELELSVGDVIHIGGIAVTVIDVDGDEVTFRVDDGELHVNEPNEFSDPSPLTLPR